MTTDLVPIVNDEVLRYLGYDPKSPATIALIRAANQHRLDPLLGEIQIIKPAGGPARVYVTRDGMLKVAHRDGRLDGIVVEEERRNSTNDGWTAKVSVWRKDHSHPYTFGAQCKDSEPQAKQGNGPEMALARAERRALHRAFAIPDDIVVGDVPEIDPVDYIDIEPTCPLCHGEPLKNAARWTTPGQPETLPCPRCGQGGEPTAIDEHRNELHDLVVQAGYDGPENLGRFRVFLSKTLRRTIKDPADLGPGDTNTVIDALRAVIVEQPAEEGTYDGGEEF